MQDNTKSGREIIDTGTDKRYVRRDATSEFLNIEARTRGVSIRTKLTDSGSSVLLPPRAIEALGVGIGAELEIEIVGRALVIRSIEEARRSREFSDVFKAVLSKRLNAYDDLAEGPE